MKRLERKIGTVQCIKTRNKQSNYLKKYIYIIYIYIYIMAEQQVLLDRECLCCNSSDIVP
jgi:hypothetical protein